jgi:hypothetical protein
VPDQAFNGMTICYGGSNHCLGELYPAHDESAIASKIIGHYTAEERKERLHRYRQKRNERNFSKKIKVRPTKQNPMSELQEKNGLRIGPHGIVNNSTWWNRMWSDLTVEEPTRNPKPLNPKP